MFLQRQGGTDRYADFSDSASEGGSTPLGSETRSAAVAAVAAAAAASARPPAGAAAAAGAAARAAEAVAAAAGRSSWLVVCRQLRRPADGGEKGGQKGPAAAVEADLAYFR
jgi:hypothetical protein